MGCFLKKVYRSVPVFLWYNLSAAHIVLILNFVCFAKKKEKRKEKQRIKEVVISYVIFLILSTLFDLIYNHFVVQ